MEADRLLNIIWTLIVLFGVLHLVEVFQGKMYKYFDLFFSSLHYMLHEFSDFKLVNSTVNTVASICFFK